MVGMCSAAFIGGTRQHAYVARLGLPEDRIVTGHNVVDNAYFAVGSAEARDRKAQLVRELNLPDRFFLLSGRFVPDKNLDRFLDAYARYSALVGEDAWDVVLLGDGPLRLKVEQKIAEHGLRDHVCLPGSR